MGQLTYTANRKKCIHETTNVFRGIFRCARPRPSSTLVRAALRAQGKMSCLVLMGDIYRSAIES